MIIDSLYASSYRYALLSPSKITVDACT